jgi:hypothetical protein
MLEQFRPTTPLMEAVVREQCLLLTNLQEWKHTISPHPAGPKQLIVPEIVAISQARHIWV